MYGKKKIYIAFALSALLIGMAAVVAIWNTSGVQAASDRENRAFVVNWGIMSLAPSQTARLNVVNIGDPNERARVTLDFDVYELGGPDTCPDATAACTNNLRFLRRESSEVTLRPGEAASFNFTAGNLEGVIILPCVRTGSESRLAPTLEIHEAARTLFVPPIAIKGFNPQPDPPGQN